ncbi:DUF4129 domain-containing protein [Deinococcus ficus]|uniref:DUF4129 domain-containing protein n=1 Tax=Deinococcus ficus TaxID=317577 RepID=UPI00174C28B7|nr:DUF4129 domain-containing protein [Deinococcus ficus]GHF72814.1 hypothetical protein GCM10017782_08030 [Deinococcus ficus]
MTRPAPPPRPADRVGPRRYALALLPLALLGLLPAWIVALLCGLYALGVRNPSWEQARLLGSLLIVGAVPLLALRSADFSDPSGIALIVGLYVITSLAVALLHWSAHELGEGKTRGLWPVIGLGLIAPQPGLLLALAGGQLARPGLDGRRGENTPWTPRVWSRLLAAGAAVLALVFMLPRVALNPANLFTPSEAIATSSAREGLPEAAPAASEDIPEEELTLTDDQRPLEFQMNGVDAQLPIELGGSLLMLAFVLGFATLWRERAFRRQGRQPRLIDLIMAAGLVLTALLWFGVSIYMSATSTGGGGEGTPEARSQAHQKATEAFLGSDAGRQLNVTPAVAILLWLLVAVTLLLVLALISYLLFVRAEREDAARRATETAPAPAPDSPPAPRHRVRLAYTQAEGLLAGTGRSRELTESPAAFARRLSALDPDLGPALDGLTRAYLPVRYGGHLTEEDADAAEAAVQDLRRLLPTLPARFLPPPEPADSRSSFIPPEATP